MITLCKFGAHFGLPDASAFCVKAEILLKMAGLKYEVDLDSFKNAPKGKLPYINDGGKTVGDSTFIRLHIEEKYGLILMPGWMPGRQELLGRQKKCAKTISIG